MELLRSMEFDESSLESWCSNSSIRRSERERRQRKSGVLHFYSDSTTAAVKDLGRYIKDPKVNEDFLITWEGREERVRITQCGGSMEEAKESQMYFERLMAVNVPIKEAIELCVYPAHANMRIRREKSKQTTNARRQECVAAIPAGDAVIGSPVPLPKPDAISELTKELRNAGSEAEKGDICLKYAAIFHGGGEEKVVLYPGYKVSIGRNAKAKIVHSSAGNPAKMQRQLLLELQGREYIMSHSATGQRFGADKSGLPPADKDTLSAVELFVKFKCSGVPTPAVASTFNKLAGNLRMYAQRREGKKYNYPRKSTKSAAATMKAADIPEDVRRILEGLEDCENSI
ncbi:uncharacterized protein LOC124165228 [Ischnura elegans]|uniref:uncharacterized protein LOC124165228 n=1 Tax=Ischnura elegans TaxID=197161 RepID=UPI001ED874A8|nr:uncharacterized protein LOC124165228 [Ischnura elegans]